MRSILGGGVAVYDLSFFLGIFFISRSLTFLSFLRLLNVLNHFNVYFLFFNALIFLIFNIEHTSIFDTMFLKVMIKTLLQSIYTIQILFERIAI